MVALMDLNANQARALRAIAESGTGVAIRKNTARALERRGLATIVGDGIMTSGAVLRLTDTGRQEALRLWREYHADRVARGLTSNYALNVIRRLEG